MNKIVKICPVCAGKGRFLTQICPTCNGKGGELSKFDPEIAKILAANIDRLNEQEKQACQWYKMGFTQKEIAQKMDISPAKAASIFYQIEKKLEA